MARNLTPFSTHGLGVGVAVDVNALSLNARRKVVTLAVPTPTRNSSTYTGFTVPAQSKSLKVVGADLCFFGIVPAGPSTATIQVDRIAVNGSSATVVVASLDILTGFTTKISNALTVATATNPVASAGQTFMVTVTCSDQAVTATGSGVLTLYLEPADPDPILST